jgi:hypothetical protein
VLFEGIGSSLPMARLGTNGRPDRAAYLWLRDHEPGPILELPAGEVDVSRRTFVYGYQTLVHRHRILNGATGYESELQAFVGSVGSPLLDFDRFGEAVEMLRSIGIRNVVVHLDAFEDRALGQATVTAFRNQDAQLEAEAAFPDIVIFRLVPWETERDKAQPAPAANPRPIAPSSFRATVSHGGASLPRAFDGDIRTRWVSGTRQTGHEWIAIDFDEPRDIARVRIRTSRRSFGDFPRHLVIEGDEGGDARTLFEGPVIAQLARGIAADPQNGPLDVWLPPNRVSRLRLRQTGQTRTWFWTIDELSLDER